MLYFFHREDGVYVQTRRGLVFKYLGPVVNAQKLVEHLEKEHIGGRFTIDRQWAPVRVSWEHIPRGVTIGPHNAQFTCTL